MKEILTVSETAQFLHKHPTTIRRWIQGKKLSARKIAIGKNGVFIILKNDLLEFAFFSVIRREKREKKSPKQSSAHASVQTHLPM